MAGMPNGAAGLDAGAWIAEWVATNNLSGLAGRTQADIQAFYGAIVQGSQPWIDATQQFFQVILGGFQDLSTFLSLLVQAITGVPGALPGLTSFMAARWNQLADALLNIGDIFGAFGGSLIKLQNFVTNILALFGLNITDANIAPTSFSVQNVLTNMINTIVIPLGLLADAAGLTEVSTAIHQIGDILTGAVITPINSGVALVKTWYTSYGYALPNAIINAGNAVNDLLAIINNAGTGLTATTLGTLIATLNTLITGVVNAFGGSVSTVQNVVLNLLKLFGISSVGTGVAGTVSGATGSFNVTTALTNFVNSLLLPLGLLADAAGLSTVSTAITQIGDILAGNVVTPINAGVTAVKTWYTSYGSSLPTTITKASQAATDLAALLSSSGQATFAALGSLVNGLLINLIAIYNAFGGSLTTFQNTVANLLRLFGFSSPGTGVAGQISGAVGSFNVTTALTSFVNTLLLPLNLLADAASFGTLQTVVNQISAIFTGAAVTAVNSTVQQIKDWWALVGTSLPTSITNAANAVANIATIVTNSGAGTVAAAGTAIGNATTNINQIGTAAQNAAAGVVGSLGTAATQVQTAFAGVLGGLFGGITQVSGPVVSQAVTNGAVSNLTATAAKGSAAASAVTAAMVTSAKKETNLKSVTVNFAPYANSTNLPAVFTQTYSGTGTATFGVNGGVAKWSGNVAPFDRTSKAIHATVTTTSDYQVVSGTLAGGTTGTTSSSLELVARSNAAGTTFVSAVISQGSISLWATVGGISTQLSAANPGVVLNPTATYTLICGVPNSGASSLRKFQLLVNGFPIELASTVQGTATADGVFTETGTVSQFGASYRYGGFLNRGNQGDGPPVYQWSMADNPAQIIAPGDAKSAYVAASQSTTSTVYGDLATVGPSVTVNIGSSGMALVAFDAYLSNSTMAGQTWMNFGITGNTTMLPDAQYALMLQAASWDAKKVGISYVISGLTPGSNTFTCKYACGGGGATAYFQDRHISVMPLP